MPVGLVSLLLWRLLQCIPYFLVQRNVSDFHFHGEIGLGHIRAHCSTSNSFFAFPGFVSGYHRFHHRDGCQSGLRTAEHQPPHRAQQLHPPADAGALLLRHRQSPPGEPRRGATTVHAAIAAYKHPRRPPRHTHTLKRDLPARGSAPFPGVLTAGAARRRGGVPRGGRAPSTRNRRPRTGAARSRLLPGEPIPPAPTFTLDRAQPVTPAEAELAGNPRARSAKLRVALRTAAPALGLDSRLADLAGLPERSQGKRR